MGYSNRILARAVAGLLGATVALAAASCSTDPTKGYALSSSYESSIRTVSVPMFQNPTYSYGLEVELTDAIIKEIQATTPWRVTTDSTATTILTGTLTKSDLQRLSTNSASGYVQEMAVRLTVDFDFKDSRTGKTLVSRRNFTASDFFVPTTGVQEKLESGQSFAVHRMAKDIVAELRSNW